MTISFIKNKVTLNYFQNYFPARQTSITGCLFPTKCPEPFQLLEIEVT